MIASLLIAATVAAAPPTRLSDAAHAIHAGRLEQARLMIGRAIAAGAKGREVDRILADLAFASNKNDEALARYQQLLNATPADSRLAERAGIAALKLGYMASATNLIDRATAAAKPSWRAWNARGVIADVQRDWPGADAAYDKASAIAANEAEVTNNRGWSQLLRGDWRAAVAYFERAAAVNPRSTRIANNLELARAALASDLPQRRAGETDSSWAERLNDAGMAAQLLGDRQRAIAAFAQAVQASGQWYARAANNLQAASGK
jgi:Flp pilus assembly protein TadD